MIESEDAPKLLSGHRAKIDVPANHPWAVWVESLRGSFTGVHRSALVMSLNGTQETFELIEVNLAEGYGDQLVFETVWRMEKEG